MRSLVDIIGKYLQVATAPFIKNPKSAELRVASNSTGDITRFRLIMEREDVARVIGRNGMTASAIRSLAKAAGERLGTRVVIHILSKDEAEQEAKLEAEAATATQEV